MVALSSRRFRYLYELGDECYVELPFHELANQVAYGGVVRHRKIAPFFLGLILGEFTVGSLWTILGIIAGIPTYGFWV